MTLSVGTVRERKRLRGRNTARCVPLIPPVCQFLLYRLAPPRPTIRSALLKGHCRKHLQASRSQAPAWECMALPAAAGKLRRGASETAAPRLETRNPKLETRNPPRLERAKATAESWEVGEWGSAGADEQRNRTPGQQANHAHPASRITYPASRTSYPTSRKPQPATNIEHPESSTAHPPFRTAQRLGTGSRPMVVTLDILRQNGSYGTRFAQFDEVFVHHCQIVMEVRLNAHGRESP